MFPAKPRAESTKLQKERGCKTQKGCSHLIPLRYCSVWLLQSIPALSAVTSKSLHQHQHRLYSTASSGKASYIHLKNLQDCLISLPSQYGRIIIRKSEQDPSHFLAFMLLVFLKESHNPSLGFYQMTYCELISVYGMHKDSLILLRLYCGFYLYRQKNMCQAFGCFFLWNYESKT